MITNQEQADLLPPRVGSEYENLNKAVIQVNERLAEGLLAKAYDSQLTDLIKQRETLMEENMLAIDNSNINSQLRSNHVINYRSYPVKEKNWRWNINCSYYYTVLTL